MSKQASEDDKAIMVGFLYGIQSDFLSADEVRHRMTGFRNTQGYKDALALIRTEKLKLLAELRERAKEMYTPIFRVDAVSISEIDKLEAEL